MTCRRCKAPATRIKSQHCDGTSGEDDDRWRCPEPGGCHEAYVCGFCDHQWIVGCPTQHGEREVVTI